MSREPHISIIVPTYGRIGVLNECVGALLAQEYPSFEIIVVSDGDPRPNFEDSRVQVFHEDAPRGSPTAKNVGIEKALGDIMIFIDDDSIPTSDDWLEQYAEEFTKAPKTVGGIGGYIDEQNPFTESDSVGAITRNSLGFYRVVSNFESPNPREVDHLKSCNFAVRASVFDDLEEPYFSPEFKQNAHREETDFALRLRKRGYRLRYTPRCRVNHKQFKSGGQRKAKTNAIFGGLQSAYWKGRNEAVFFRRHFYSGGWSVMAFVLQEATTHRGTPLKHLAKLCGVIHGALG